MPTTPAAPRPSVLTSAQRAAALINAATADPSALAEILRAHGEPEPVALTDEDADALRAAAGLLREVFDAPDTDRAAAALNRLLREHTGPLRLTTHGGATGWHPHLDRDDDAPWDEWLIASSCLALAVLLWERGRPPGGSCAAARCRNVYLTQGSGPERRYCSRRCATRERVAAHRRARIAEEPPIRG
ncbi:CGNR zinc finger domain-containing protein [Kitasatospora sp. CB01950]|uniref:CGNR zinc finger domain-containing protein n=1 Tax=Kitasatospora sp. CB01950 TaxID=1703930 RepID=UPI001F52387C|nr:CGNR zinc finger domain-containing protein [Kitasatospora sp. CB01950]